MSRRGRDGSRRRDVKAAEKAAAAESYVDIRGTDPLPQLTEPVISKVERDIPRLLYRYTHDKYTFTVEVTPMPTSVLSTLRAIDFNGKVLFHSDLPQDEYHGFVELTYDMLDRIEIKNVAIGARGHRLCTKAVAYTMKSLLHFINGKKMFAYKGQVYIRSKHAKNAFNCYNRAFLTNGYKLKTKEGYKRFCNKNFDQEVGFTFNSYVNEKQRLLRLGKNVDHIAPLGPLDARPLRF